MIGFGKFHFVLIIFDVFLSPFSITYYSACFPALNIRSLFVCSIGLRRPFVLIPICDGLDRIRSILGSKSTSFFLYTIFFFPSLGQMILFLSLSDLILLKITVLLDESRNFWVFEGWFFLFFFFNLFFLYKWRFASKYQLYFRLTSYLLYCKD